jgi:hypothetical protein
VSERTAHFISRVAPRVEIYQRKFDETQTAELKRLRERNRILERQIGGLQLLMEEMKDAARLRVEETKILNERLDDMKAEHRESVRHHLENLASERAKVKALEQELSNHTSSIANRPPATASSDELPPPPPDHAKGDSDSGSDGDADAGVPEEVQELRQYVARMERALELAQAYTLHKELERLQRRNLKDVEKSRLVAASQREEIEKLEAQVKDLKVEKQTLLQRLEAKGFFASAETASKIEAAKAEAELEAIAVGDTATLPTSGGRESFASRDDRPIIRKSAALAVADLEIARAVASVQEANVWAATKENPDVARAMASVQEARAWAAKGGNVSSSPTQERNKE